MENILVVIESDWVKEMRFIEFGLSEAFATRLHLKCTVQHILQKWDQIDIDHGINLFVRRAKRLQNLLLLPDRYLYLATGAVTMTLEDVQRPLAFAVIAVLKRGAIAGLTFEPLTDLEYEPALDEFIEARMAYTGCMCPAYLESRKKREEIQRLMYTTMRGFEIGKELRSASRSTAVRIPQN